MKKINVFGVVFLLAFMSLANFQDENQSHESVLSSETRNLMQANGFSVLGACYPVRSPRMLDSTNLPETSYIRMSLDVRQANNLQITWLGTPVKQKMAASQNDIILSENFEGDFPGANWHRSGNPTWGKSTYQKHGGQNSVFCAKDSTAGVTPPANYPNNMNAMMVFGPFDLSDASLAFVRFWFWLETEVEKDIFWYGASSDGNIFGLIGLSGSTGTYSPAWEQTTLNLADVPQLGSLIGKSSVWIAFGFSSDSTGAKRGAFVDDVEVQKAAVGTGISGYLKGSLSPAGNPYIAFDHIGVAQGDSLEILPGCELRFNAAIEFVVQGLLDARGTEGDSIKFTSNKTSPKAGDWVGIGFYAGSSSSTIQHSCINYSRNGLIFSQGGQLISNNLINNNITGITSYAYVTIKENRIISNSGSGIDGNYSLGFITENIITNNFDGISIFFSNPVIKNNSISNNKRYGIVSKTSDPVIVQNAIERNGSDGINSSGGYLYIPAFLKIIGNKILDNGGYGFYLWDLASADFNNNLVKNNNQSGIDFSKISSLSDAPSIDIINNTIVNNDSSGINCGSKFLYNSRIVNNIIKNNGRSGIISRNAISFQINYNDLFNNHPNFNFSFSDSLGILSKINANGDSCDKFFNIFKEPLFENENNNDFHLKSTSPCKNAGNSNVFFNDEDSTINNMGFYGGGQLYINFSDYNFNRVLVGTSKKIDLIIKNYRDYQLILSSIQLSDLINFSLSPIGNLTIPSYESKSITVTYKPQDLNPHSSILSLSGSAFYSPSPATIIFRGEGTKGTKISGSVSGRWTKYGSPYIISGHTKIPEGQKLVIEPGVEIKYDGRYEFIVNGQLEAIGTPEDSITFTQNESTEESQGKCLGFYAKGDTSRIAYCIIEKMRFEQYKDGAIHIENSSPVSIAHSRISNNIAPGIKIKNSAAIISHNLITNNSYAGIEYPGGGRGIVYGNTIENNKDGGIDCFGGPSSEYNNRIVIQNNLIKNNGNYGIRSIYTYAIVLNNILTGNFAARGGGIYFNSTKLILINNIIYKNTAREYGGGVFIDRSTIEVFALNNIIWDNYAPSNPQIYRTGIISLTHSNVQGGWTGTGNINSDPLFLDPTKTDFHLLSNSPCIDAGDPDTLLNDPEDPNRPGFALAPAQGTIRNDMGAFGGPGAAGELAHLGPLPFSLISPSNDDTLNTQTPTLIWQKTINPFTGDKVVYTLLIDKNQNFSSAKIYSNLADTSYTLNENLAASTVYYWKVIASNSFDFKTTSREVFKFTVGNLPPKSFSLISPLNGDTLSTSTPVFKWHKAIDPNPGDKIHYKLEIDTTQNFSAVTNFTNIADTTIEIQVELRPDLIYFWRVIASDSLGLKTPSKEVFKFTIGNMNPRPFSLLLPINADTVFTTSPTLEWEQAIDPNPGDSISYSLHYSPDSTFAEADTVKGIAKLNHKLVSLHDHQSYFWKIVADDNRGGSQASRELFQFFTFAAPLPFNLISPATGDTVKNDTLIFDWHSAFDPNPEDSIHYTLLYDTSRTFIKPGEIKVIADTFFIFTDSLANDSRYYWTVMAVDKDSFTTASSDTFSFLVRYLPTGVVGTDDFSIPTEFSLSQNYPNPFNPVTTIRYQLPQATETRLEIFNLRGQRVAALVDCKQPAGYYAVTWDGKDAFGHQVASGIYLFRLETKEFTKVRKLALIK